MYYICSSIPHNSTMTFGKKRLKYSFAPVLLKSVFLHGNKMLEEKTRWALNKLFKLGKSPTPQKLSIQNCSLKSLQTFI